MVREPYKKVFSPSSVQKGFQVAGIEPFNPEIFEDDEYLLPSVTDPAAPDTVTTIPVKSVEPEMTVGHVDDIEPEITLVHVETSTLNKVSASVGSIISP